MGVYKFNDKAILLLIWHEIDFDEWQIFIFVPFASSYSLSTFSPLSTKLLCFKVTNYFQNLFFVPRKSFSSARRPITINSFSLPLRCRCRCRCPLLDAYVANSSRLGRARDVLPFEWWADKQINMILPMTHPSASLPTLGYRGCTQHLGLHRPDSISLI